MIGFISGKIDQITNKKIIRSLDDKLLSQDYRIKIIIRFIFSAFVILQCYLILVFFSPSSVQKRASKSVNIKYENSELKDYRVDIVDRNGVLIAQNITSYDFYVYPSKMLDIDLDLNKIINIFPHLESRRDRLYEVMQKKSHDPRGMVLILNNIFPIEKQKILSSGILGIEFQESQRRIYPHNNTASHLIGFISSDGIGVAGVEREFDSYLKNPQNPPLELSIDMNIQSILRNTLVDAVKKNGAKSGVGVIVKIKTGELIAASSVPDFNPNNLKNYTNNHLFNRFSLGVYELGSVFKVFLAALAVESGISINKKFNTKDPIVIGDYTIHDFRASLKYNELSLIDIMRKSSNIGCARVIQEVKIEDQISMMEKLNMLDKIPLELPEKGKPLHPQKWKFTQAVTISYGHGIAVTPLHLVYGISSVINNGKSIRPTLLKQVFIKNKTDGESIVSPKTSKVVRNLLREIITTGSGRRGASEKYDVGGKSGTAIQVRGKKYSVTNNIVSFFAAVPMSDPEYAYYIMIEDPKIDNKQNTLRNVTGSSIAAPVVSELISTTGPMLNIQIMNNNEIAKNNFVSNALDSDH